MAVENFLVTLCNGMDLVPFDGKKAVFILEVDAKVYSVLSVVGADWSEYEPEPDDEPETAV